MADSKNLLLDVPPELADQIAHYLPKKDLLALRSVSKDVSARCDRAVLRYIPDQLHIMFSVRWSLKNALLISGNTTWRKAIKSVTVYQDHFSERALTHPDDCVNNLPGPAINRRKVGRPPRQFYETYVFDQDSMVKSDTDLQLLTHMMSNLSGNEHGVEVVVADQGYNTSRDLAKLKAELKGAVWAYNNWEDDRPLASVLNAIQQSGLKPSGFKAGDHGGEKFAVPMYLFSSPGHFSNTQGTFSRLRSLRLWLYPAPHPDHAKSEEKDIESFIVFLKSISSHLRVFDCTTSGSSPFGDDIAVGNAWDVIFSRIADEVTFSALEYLAVFGMHISYQKLVRFFGRHALTLKETLLENIWAFGCGDRVPAGQFAKKFMDDLKGVGVDIEYRNCDIENID